MLFSENERNAGDLKRSNDLVSPRSDTTITPDTSHAPKRHCLFPGSQEDTSLLSPDSGLDRTRSLSDSFDQVMSSGSQFDDPVQSSNNVTPRVHSSDSSPVTISSGYESDSLPTREAEIDKIFVKRNKQKSKPSNLEPTTDYFSLSESYPANLNVSVADMGYRPQQPPKVIVTRVPEKLLPHTTNSASTRVIDNANTISVPDKSSVRNIRATEGNFQCQLPLKPRRQIQQETSQARFSPAQRHSYQLTKVARSMFQIIHDLQDEKDAADNNKRKCRKVKRAPAFKGDTPPAAQTNKVVTPEVGASPAMKSNLDIVETPRLKELDRDVSRPIRVNGANQEKPLITTEQSVNPVTASNTVLPQPQGKFTVKCVRRPLGSNPADFARDLPHSSSAVDYLQDENVPRANSKY